MGRGNVRRADGLGRGDVLLDYCSENGCFAVVKHVGIPI